MPTALHKHRQCKENVQAQSLMKVLAFAGRITCHVTTTVTLCSENKSCLNLFVGMQSEMSLELLSIYGMWCMVLFCHNMAFKFPEVISTSLNRVLDFSVARKP